MEGHTFEIGQVGKWTENPLYDGEGCENKEPLPAAETMSSPTLALTQFADETLTKRQKCMVFLTVENVSIFFLLVGCGYELFATSLLYSSYPVHRYVLLAMALQLFMLESYFISLIVLAVFDSKLPKKTNRPRQIQRAQTAADVALGNMTKFCKRIRKEYLNLFDVNGQYFLLKMYIDEAFANSMQLYNMVYIYLCLMPLPYVAILSAVLSLEIGFIVYHSFHMVSQETRDRQLMIDLLCNTFCLVFPLAYYNVNDIPLDPDEALYLCAVPTIGILMKVYDIWTDLFKVDIERVRPKLDTISRRSRSSTRRSIFRLSVHETIMRQQLRYFPDWVRNIFLCVNGLLGVVFVSMIVVQVSSNPSFEVCAKEHGTEIWRGCVLPVSFCVHPYVAACDCAIVKVANFSEPKIHPDFAIMKSLISLQVVTGKLESLPTTFATDHPKLKVLRIIGNRLKVLPQNIGDMSELLLLDVGVNQLRELPESLGRVYVLQHLNVRMNNLTSLPSSLQRMGKLRSLIANNNRLDQLPSWIGGLASLLNIQVQHNLLRELPNEIGELDTLTVLFAWNNLLGVLPSTMGDMVSMQVFDARNNRLADLPSSISRWENIVHIDVEGNPLCFRQGIFLGKASCSDMCAADCPRVLLGNGMCDDSKYLFDPSLKTSSAIGKGCNTQKCLFDNGDCSS